MLKKILLGVILWKIIVFSLIMTFDKKINDANIFIPRKGTIAYNVKVVRVLANFDGVIYIEIARRGYKLPEVPFFPLHPLIIHTIAQSFNSRFYAFTAEILSNLYFICALYFCLKLLKLDDKKIKIPFFLFVILTFPTAFYYGTAYNDSLFFFLATLTIYFGRQRKWLYAGITGGLATLARLNGLALFFYLWIEYLSFVNRITFINDIQWTKNKLLGYVKKTLHIKELFLQHMYATILIPIAYVSYLTYIQFRFGSWKYMFSAMKTWNQDKMTFPLQVFWRYFKIIVLHPTPHQLNYWIAVNELMFVFLYIFILCYFFKKIRISYWLFLFLSFLIPSLTGTFQGMPRYALHLYPFFLCLTLFLQNRVLLFKLVYFLLAISLSIVLLLLYTNGYFVA